MTGRRDFVEAAEAARAVIFTAVRADLSSLERRVFEIVVALVPMYSRATDDLGTRQIAQVLYGVDEPKRGQRDRVSRALRTLGTKVEGLTVEPRVGRLARTRVTFETPRELETSLDDERRRASDETPRDGDGNTMQARVSNTTRAGVSNTTRRVCHSGEIPGEAPGEPNRGDPPGENETTTGTPSSSGAKAPSAASPSSRARSRSRHPQDVSDFSEYETDMTFESLEEAAEWERQQQEKRS